MSAVTTSHASSLSHAVQLPPRATSSTSSLVHSHPSPTQSPPTMPTDLASPTFLDSEYTGHLLLDATSPDAPSTATLQTPDMSMDIKPFVFDPSGISETCPWWGVLYSTDPEAAKDVLTAEEMFKAFQDPFAEYRRKMPYPAPMVRSSASTTHALGLAMGAGAGKLTPKFSSAVPTSALANDTTSYVTPPGQLYQRFDYEDALLRIPDMFSAVPDHGRVEEQSTTVATATTSLPPFSVLENRIKAETHVDDTPVELIEAAVAALMTTHSADHSMMMDHSQDHMWVTPASATFGGFPTHGLPTTSGVIRSRALTMPNAQQPDATWFTAQDMLQSPDAFAMGAYAHDHDPDAIVGDGHHPCLWLGCNQVLPSPSALTIHVNRYHIARRQPAHRCLWQGCPRAHHIFRHRDKILIHIRLHTNDRPWMCDAPGCEKTFSRVDSLEAHKKVHSAEGKSWQCRADGCGRMYFHAKSLKKHERTVHGLDLEV